MILLINICKEKLHFYEFVKPVGDILIKNKVKGFIGHYSCLTKRDLQKAEKIIICGTGLQDNDIVNNFDKFSWLKDFKKPVLGICGGMQIIGLVFGGKLKKGKEIGFYNENFKDNFLGLKGKKEVYHLHNYYVTILKDFEIFSQSGKIPQAIKHKTKPIYGVLFHPEVRNKEMVLEFVRL
jgi:GMP synthase (glutamine-hydrolysing)